LLLFTRSRLPAWAIILLQIIQWVPDWKARIEFWLDAARSMGGYIGTAATVVASPYFNPGLLVFALAWLFFIGEPARGVQRDPRWRYLGWGIFAICLVAVIVTVGYGAIEIYIREQIAGRQATVLHDGSNPNTPPQPDDPNFSFQRKLSPDQFRELIRQAAKLKSSFFNLPVATPPGDTEAYVFGQYFHDALMRGGIPTSENERIAPEGPEQTGIMIAVYDPHNPPEAAKRLREALEIVGLVANFIERRGGPPPIILFVGPKPL
jgi:hypothetical protein